MNDVPMIDVQDLSRHYGSVVALDGVSFQVPKGAVVGFLGPNGAGKTTTMKLLTGTLAPTRGRARVAGLEVDHTPAFRRRLGYLPENAPVYPELDVEAYLLFVARVRGIRRTRRHAAVSQAVERCGLGEMRRRPLGALSKGYRQRVGIAQAIVHNPEVLILDEPTTGLDPNQMAHIRTLVRTLGQDKTVLLSSHLLDEVQAVASRVIILDRGRLVADGSPEALAARLHQGRIRVVVRGDGTGLEAALAPVPGLGAVSLSSDAAATTCLIDGPGHLRPEVAAALVGAGFALLALDETRADLGEVFRQLTGEAS